MKSLARAAARVLGTLKSVCMYCNIGQHCGGCSCCMQRP